MFDVSCQKTKMKNSIRQNRIRYLMVGLCRLSYFLVVFSWIKFAGVWRVKILKDMQILVQRNQFLLK